jgi:hypothetical protein
MLLSPDAYGSYFIFPWQLLKESIAWPGKYENDGGAIFKGVNRKNANHFRQ